ncbi:MAG: DUF1471 domain-containing protein [Gammaproteobacteria bacterium]|nr:DUF1471 domain-containing protein [Gammaproteobacteria bacterium]MBI5783620.1 DUF1471 domain-containing protein [Gammaproteobacteria bacterium]
MIRCGWLFVLFSFLTGCATPEAEILSKTESFPPTLSVEVLLDRPTRPHKTIAILGDIYGGAPEEVNERLARKAREIGADAVIIVSVHDQSTTDWLLDDPYYYPHGVYRPHYRPVKHNYRIVRARAIKYLK